jgi:hypothetical protein
MTDRYISEHQTIAEPWFSTARMTSDKGLIKNSGIMILFWLVVTSTFRAKVISLLWRAGKMLALLIDLRIWGII